MLLLLPLSEPEFPNDRFWVAKLSTKTAQFAMNYFHQKRVLIINSFLYLSVYAVCVSFCIPQQILNFITVKINLSLSLSANFSSKTRFSFCKNLHFISRRPAQKAFVMMFPHSSNVAQRNKSQYIHQKGGRSGHISVSF